MEGEGLVQDPCPRGLWKDLHRRYDLERSGHRGGRILQTTLGEIIQDYTKQHIKIRVKVTSVTGDAAYTEFVGHELTRDYMRSMVKRRTSRVDTILPVKTKDGTTLRITMTCLTLTRANLSQVHAIRSAMSQFVLSYAAQREFPAFVKEMVSGEVTKELFKLVKPIYPVRRVEIIKSRVEPEAKAGAGVKARGTDPRGEGGGSKAGGEARGEG